MAQTRVILLSLATLLMVVSTAQAGKIKCWTNSDGIRECGNVLPPEYAQQEHETLNSQGVTTKHFERAKTPEELAEAKRLADIKAEEERLLKEQYERDQILLQTFSNEDEISMARNGKITAIKTELRLTRASMQNTRDRLRTYHQQAASLERASKPINDKLASDIKLAEQQIADYETFISSKEKEKELIQANFERDMKRYQELKPGLSLPKESTGK
jgi:hypothetical protein